MKLKFPEEFIEQGERVPHSGQISDTFYNVNRLITRNFFLRHILRNIPANEHYIGISTGGALIAMAAHTQYIHSRLSIIKEGQLLGERPSEAQWYLIDDVVTTGKSLLEAISLVGSNPKEIIVTVDRRPENANPEVRAIFQP